MRSSTIKQTTYFWIDAVCIDQSNIHERNHQVNLMKEIYTAASNVDIWLGAEADDSNLAIRYINTRAKKSPTEAGLGYKKVWSSRVGRAVSELCERPYWRRMWIIQEVCHADDIVVWCGQKHFPWSNLEALYLRLKVLEDTSWFAHHQFAMRVLQSSACVMVWQRAHWRHRDTPTPSLQTLIEVFHSWHCTDIRDKVFALVGMADPKTTITPDYEKTTVQVYYDVVRRNDEEGTKWCNLLSQVLAIPEKSCGLGGRQLYVYGKWPTICFWVLTGIRIEYKQQPAQRLVLRKRIESEFEDSIDPRC